MSPAVALLGNMNNNHFALARHLRDRGVDAEVLFFDRTPSHFLPECDTFADDFRTFTRQLDWGSVQRFPFTSRRTVRRDLAPYNVLIGSGAAPAYCQKAARPLDVFVPVGGDLWNYTGRRSGQAWRLVKYWPIIPWQRAGIRACDVFHMTPTNTLYEGQWERFRGRSRRWRFGLPIVYGPAYAKAPPDDPSLAVFRRARKEADLLLFSAARHEWTCDPRLPEAKGTHRLLRGLALFLKQQPTCRARLITFEYGSDVRESKRLIAALGLEHVVTWLPKMQRKHIMAGLAMADIGCAEFENSWVASGVLYEALALGVPVLAYRDDESYENPAALYPILNAREPEEIAGRLHEAWSDPSRLRRLGMSGRRWYRDEVVETALQHYVGYIHGATVEAHS